MNTLLVGTNKQFAEYIDFSSRFLLIDDGPIIDALDVPRGGKITHFDVAKHSFNPLERMDYRRARNFIATVDALFPEGENTLTRKNSNFVLLQALLSKPKALSNLVTPDPKDPARQDAYQKIQTLLMSPVLRSVLCHDTNFALGKTILARLDRAAIGDFDAFTIASFLVSHFKGQVIIPDFGFYGRAFHTALIRQGRLIAGLNFLAEVPPAMQQTLLTIPQKIAAHAIFDDAEVLARHAGHRPDPLRADNPYNDFLDAAMA